MRDDALYVTARALASLVKGSAIGGELTLTNYRFHFASHGLNSTRGAYSIFVPTVRDASEITGLISDQLTLTTRTATHRFTVRKSGRS
jgi:hypothetical protein